MRAPIDAAFDRMKFESFALEESVKLQSHYAKLLNMHDGGRRLEFKDANEWRQRLKMLREKSTEKDNAGENG